MSKKPFVVFFIDGMGIEDAKSYNLYNSTVMPTLDAFTSRYLFSSLNSSGASVGLSENASATRDLGYLNVGAGTVVKQSIEIVNSKIENNMFFNNESFNNLVEHVKKNNSTLHLITLIGNKYGIDSTNHLRKAIEYFNSINLKNVCIHLYLGANSNSLNKSFSKYTANIHRILNLYPHVKLGIIAGINYLKDSSSITITKELYKVTVGGVGEQWINYNDAVESNYKRNYLEENIVPFIVSRDGLIKNNDGIFLFNYENGVGSVYSDILVDPSKYMYTDNKDINIKVTSLFPLNNQTSSFCFNYESVKTSFYCTLNKNGIKHLLITEKNNIPYMNYYFNGCNSNQAVQVVPLDIPNNGDYNTNMNGLYSMITSKVNEAINTNYYDLIVASFPIVDKTKVVNTENIKSSMISIDNCLHDIYNSVISLNGTLYITSCYGINEVIYNHKNELVNVNFSKKVPFIIVDNELPLDQYGVVSGNLCDISTTILNNLSVPIQDGMTGKNLLVKKTSGKKKKNNKILLILLVIIILAVIVIALFSMGLL
ncbi:MAG: hypothetical protein J6D28_04090 [Bacilli bacterium]|nr:hypothetical protein [Bacilli bacterium]